MHAHDEGPARRADGGAPEPAVEVLRSEERLVAATERVPVRRARLQRFVVTEQRTITVEVRHEEARLVYDDIAPGEEPRVDPSVDATPPMLLREERIEVVRTIVPVERVRLVKDRVTTEQTLTGTVRQERFDLDADGR